MNLKLVHNIETDEKTKEALLKIVDQNENYYIPRKLSRFIRIDRKILETEQNDFTIVHTEEEFNDKHRNTEMEKIHFLLETQNHLLWQKSSASISKLREYLIRKEGDEESIEETEIFDKNNEKILIISAEPGLGKSLILDHFTLKSNEKNFFIKINLNTCTKSLSEFWDLEKRLKNIVDFIESAVR